MPRAERLNRFLIEPARIRYDRAVLAMTPKARGAYYQLWLAAWDQREPGILEPADDVLLASLAMVSQADWAEVREQVATAFDTGHSGRWISTGMVETFKAQAEYAKKRKAIGKAAANARYSKGKDARCMEEKEKEREKDLRPTASGVASSPLRSEDAPQAAPGDPAGKPGAVLLGVVRGLAAAKAPHSPAAFPADQAWTWVTGELKPKDPRAAMAFMAWAWKALGPDLAAIRGMVLEWRDKRIGNPYAYFAPNGVGSCRIDAAASDRNERESARLKADERAWLEDSR